MATNDVEALCAAAYDCKPEGRRLVGLPPQLVRALEAVARAAEAASKKECECGYCPACRTMVPIRTALAKLREVRRG